MRNDGEAEWYITSVANGRKSGLAESRGRGSGGWAAESSLILG